MGVDENRSQSAARKFRDWYQNSVLPLWIANCYDHTHGGFFEALNFDGEPAPDLDRRVRVQARQVYVMSRVASLSWRPEAEQLADQGFQYFLDKACPDNGARGCVHILNPDGSVLDNTRDLYDQAFLLLACAWRWRTVKDQRALGLAEQTLAFLNEELASPHGGWIENGRSDLPRRQNPHMHLFEAFMALYDATREEKYLLEADKIFSLFENKFFDSEHCVLREFFTENLTYAAGQAGARIEPGHMVEWVWLLSEYAQRRKIDVSKYQNQLYRSAQTLGAVPGSLFLVDNLSLGAEAGGARRLWPQTEYLKAASVFANQRNVDAHLLIEHLIGACFDTYFDQSVSGLWCDQFDGDGNPCAENVPASILYHLLDAVLAVQPKD